MSKESRFSYATMALLLLALVLPAQGQTSRWSNSTSDGTWTNAASLDNAWTNGANWDSGVPVAGVLAVIPSNSAAITVGSPSDVGAIDITDPGDVYISGSPLTIDGVGGLAVIKRDGNAHKRIDCDLVLAGSNLVFERENVAGALLIAGDISSTTGQGAVFRGSYGKSSDHGSRTFTIYGNNTYSGDTTIMGYVAFGSDTAFSRGTVYWNYSSKNINSHLASSGSTRKIANDFVLDSNYKAGQHFLINAKTLSYQVIADLHLNGNISGGNTNRQLQLVSDDGGAIHLSGTNTFLDTIKVDYGTVYINGLQSHARFVDDADASTLRGTGSIVWHEGELMDLDQSTLIVSNLTLQIAGALKSSVSYTIAKYATLVGEFESVTMLDGGLATLDYGSGTSNSVSFVVAPRGTTVTVR